MEYAWRRESTLMGIHKCVLETQWKDTMEERSRFPNYEKDPVWLQAKSLLDALHEKRLDDILRDEACSSISSNFEALGRYYANTNANNVQ
jgi:hypothetical protein